MKKLTILVDMDDTIEGLLDAWLDCVNEKYGYHTVHEDVVNWDVSKAFPGLTHEQVYSVIEDNEFWKQVKPLPGAVEALQRFVDQGHEVYIVTAAGYQSVAGKMEYHLFHWFPFITWDHVIITSNKHLIRGDVLIDDGFHNLQGGEYAKILVDAPYNRMFDEKAEGMVRVFSWPEIEAQICKLSDSGDGSFVTFCGYKR